MQLRATSTTPDQQKNASNATQRDTDKAHIPRQLSKEQRAYSDPDLSYPGRRLSAAGAGPISVEDQSLHSDDEHGDEKKN